MMEWNEFIDFLGKQLSSIHNGVNKTLNKKYVEMTIEDDLPWPAPSELERAEIELKSRGIN